MEENSCDQLEALFQAEVIFYILKTDRPNMNPYTAHWTSLENFVSLYRKGKNFNKSVFVLVIFEVSVFVRAFCVNAGYMRKLIVKWLLTLLRT